MKNKFLNICIGVTMMLFGAGFFVRSIHSANANPPSPQEFIDGGTNSIGKYMWIGDGSHYMIWDTETGKNIQYSYSGGWQKMSEQLPENPMGN